LISLNYSFFVQLFIFLFLVIILNQFLFKPVLKIWQEREEAIEGKRKKAQELEKQVNELAQRLNQELEKAQERAQKEEEKLKQKFLRQQEELIQKTRSQANEMIAELREKIALEYKTALSQLEQEAENLAQKIAEQILGRKISG